MSLRKHLPVCLGVFAFCFVVAVYVIPNVDQTLWFTGIRSYARQKVNPAILSREHQGRRETIQKFCGNQPPSYNISQNIYRYFSFSKRHRLLYCGIQKVGTSFLLRVMKLLIGRVGEGELFNKSFLHGQGMRGKASFSDERNTPETIHKILENYDHKFFFVRDPFSRLFSAYMDKVFLPDCRMFAIARRVIIDIITIIVIVIVIVKVFLPDRRMFLIARRASMNVITVLVIGIVIVIVIVKVFLPDCRMFAKARRVIIIVTVIVIVIVKVFLPNCRMFAIVRRVIIIVTVIVIVIVKVFLPDCRMFAIARRVIVNVTVIVIVIVIVIVKVFLPNCRMFAIVRRVIIIVTVIVTVIVIVNVFLPDHRMLAIARRVIIIVTIIVTVIVIVKVFLPDHMMLAIARRVIIIVTVIVTVIVIVKVFLPDHRMFAIAKQGGLTREEEEGGGESSRQCLLNVTFQTFLEVVTSHKKNDPHWLPMHRHCDPCNVRFHYVGKMETFRADLEFILGQAGVDLDLLSPDRDSFDSDTDLRALQDLARHNYRKARASLCPAETYMCRVMEKIWITLQTRGFLSMKVPYPFPAKNCLAYNQTTFMDTLVAAYRQSGTHEARMHQRKEAMMEAYYRLPADLLKRAEDYVRDDCAMFGYNCSVEARFPQGGLRELQYSYFGSYA
ncbi:uncharacterized protein [Littorina saxatilis]|uniref:uncharacterized protein isoform X1 n=1 Tax=Littorina saxatilis TaxID=31220 RepID=UPI0038B656BB